MDMSYEELEKMMSGSGGRQKVMEHLNDIEVQQIQLMCWDFFSAYKMGDNQRAGRIFQIICDITEIKVELPTLQEYFKGKKIGKYTGTISMKMASKYVAHVTSEIRSMTDPRVKASPIQ